MITGDAMVWNATFQKRSSSRLVEESATRASSLTL